MIPRDRRVLLTGDDVVARDTARWLDRLGATPVRHTDQDLAEAVAGCDAVVVRPWDTAFGLDTIEDLVPAMVAAGAGRLVVAAPPTADRAAVARLEVQLADTALEWVLARCAAVVGRRADGAVAGLLTQSVLVLPRDELALAVVHHDDVGRFLAGQALGGPTGPVELAAEGVVGAREAAALLGRPLVRAVSPTSDVLRSVGVPDTTRLREAFGFRCAYSASEALADMGRAAVNTRAIGSRRWTKVTALGVHEPPPFISSDADGRSLRLLGADVAGTFDEPVVDPAYPEWTGANVGEAFPSPMTPLGLELAIDMMRVTGPMVLEFIGSVDESTDRAARSKMITSIGHGVRVNLTLLRDVNAALPGQTPEEFEHNILGVPLPQDFTPAKPALRDVPELLRMAGRTLPKLLGLSRQVALLIDRSHEVARLAGDEAALDDVTLMARIDQVWDETVRWWITTGATTFLVSVPQAAVERSLGPGALARVDTGEVDLLSLGPLKGVLRMLEAAAATDGLLDRLRSAAAAERVALLRAEAPQAAQVLDEVLAEYGHRGPGEMELANGVYADRPDLLVEAMLHARTDQPPAREGLRLTARQRKLAARAHAAIARREQARDATSRMMHGLRRLVREHGRRLVASGAIQRVDDVFFLRRRELFAPGDVHDVVAERRRERDRLAATDLPITFNGPWTPTEVAVGEATVLSGLGVSPGTARGAVRVLRDATQPLEPGEILVTKVTDVGWTPLFGAAAAVVTDLGASMSHAAIVAREFGIPAVVSATDASRRLRTGQVVEVDGSAGTVRVIDD